MFFVFYIKCNCRLENYKKESNKANNAMTKMIVMMSRMVDMPEVPGQIKRVSAEILENRQLSTQHIAQINFLEEWLTEQGINIRNPPAPPRKPPTKKRKTSESSSPLGNWLQVTAPNMPEQLECKNCSVVIPSTFNKIIKTLHKKTRRSLSLIHISEPTRPY